MTNPAHNAAMKILVLHSRAMHSPSIAEASKQASKQATGFTCRIKFLR